MSRFKFLLLLLMGSLAQGHVGSADIYLDAQAGPYPLFITVRPPTVIPGVAEIEVRSGSAAVHEIAAVPVPLSKEGAKFAPVPDRLKVSAQDRQFFTGSLWMMASGSWQIRLTVNGTEGTGAVAVPIPAVALSTKPMQTGMAIALFSLMCLLIAGLVLLVGASAREAKLAPGVLPDASSRQRARIAMAATFVIAIAIVSLGYRWWRFSEANYRTKVYKPLEMAASLSPAGQLTLRLANPEWMNQPIRNASANGPALFTRSMDDLVPDHDHLMHLYAIRQPGLDAVYHLHPELSETGIFHLQLPAMKAGSYRLYADVVHANGFAETMVAPLQIPEVLPGRALQGDDAAGFAPAWQANARTTKFQLPDGYTMEWVQSGQPLRAKAGTPFHFRLLDPQGRAASGMQFYMGMLGHAAFVKTDGSTFAHVHPTGSVPMASYMMAQSQLGQSAGTTGQVSMAGMDMPGMDHPAALPNEVLFPYGFPAPGQYRIFVQMKHSGVVETGVFDALMSQ